MEVIARQYNSIFIAPLFLLHNCLILKDYFHPTKSVIASSPRFLIIFINESNSFFLN